jgi:Tfp pilus assembly protein PilF
MNNQVVYQKAGERNEMGLAYLEKGNVTNAMSQFSKACLLAPNEPTYFLHKAESLVEAGEISTAIITYRIAIQKITQSQPHDDITATPRRQLYLETRLASIHYLYGQVLLDKKRYAESLDNFQAAFEYGWNQDQVQLRMALVHIGMKDLDVALQLICDLLIRSPRNVSLLALRARIYVLLDMVDFVNIDIEQIASIDKTHHCIKQLERYGLLTYT